MTLSWSIRRALPEDARHVAAHGAYQAGDEGRRQGYETWVGPRIESGAYVGWLAVSGEQVVGGAGAVLLDWGPTRSNPCGTMARVVNVFTVPEWRGNGIARTLLRLVCDHCEASGIREFNLAATAEARHLYLSFGFEVYGAEMRRRVVL
jgi:GNAT superfamily N-acetyltransferase